MRKRFSYCLPFSYLYSNQGAIRQRLESQGLYSEDGTYQLDVTMLKVDQPLFGLNLEVTKHVQYVLTNRDTGEVVFDDTVVAPHTAGVSDAVMAVKGLRLAIERAAQKNIEELLDKLSELQIDAKEISMAI